MASIPYRTYSGYIPTDFGDMLWRQHDPDFVEFVNQYLNDIWVVTNENYPQAVAPLTAETFARRLLSPTLRTEGAYHLLRSYNAFMRDTSFVDANVGWNALVRRYTTQKVLKVDEDLTKVMSI